MMTMFIDRIKLTV